MQIRLGEKIRELRRRSGRKQEDLASALGVTGQAVSRWECGSVYPDTELLPAIAHYFGVTIDELFGYESDRQKKVDGCFDKIMEMNHQNNGVDVCADECIAFARECLAEFPEEKKLLYGLASALFNAGYVRYGEHHLDDAEGYDVYDTERHRKYREWQEAIRLYEKLLTVLEPGELRDRAVRELLQLYVNCGEREKAFIVAETLPDLSSCREMMKLSCCDGKERAAACAEALLVTADSCAHLLVASVTIHQANFPPETAAEIIRSAIAVYRLVMPDGNFGIYHAALVCMNLYLSEHLWRAGDHDGAFDALEEALEHAHKTEEQRRVKEQFYTAPAVRLAKIEEREFTEAGIAANLAEDWPWWAVPDCSDVKREMEADPRWADWVRRTKE